MPWLCAWVNQMPCKPSCVSGCISQDPPARKLRASWPLPAHRHSRLQCSTISTTAPRLADTDILAGEATKLPTTLGNLVNVIHLQRGTSSQRCMGAAGDIFQHNWVTRWWGCAFWGEFSSIAGVPPRT